MDDKKDFALIDDVTVLRQRIAELEGNEIKFKQMEKTIRASKERLKSQFRLTNIPTITWQKKGTDFIIADYNITMEDFTEGLIGNYLDKPASLIYEDRPDIRADLNKCFNKHCLISN